jgi:hypothetical protein
MAIMGDRSLHRECHLGLRVLCNRIASTGARDDVVVDGAQGHSSLKAR